MVLPILNRHYRETGFTLIELMLVIALVAVLSGILFVILRPGEQMKKGRDLRRISDITFLDRAVNEYRIDHGVYPDGVSLERTSTSLPLGNIGDFANCSEGWLDVDMCDYLSKTAIDPINDEIYYYSYISTGTEYELNAALENVLDLMLNDRGNSDSKYEFGNNLELL